MLDFWIPFLVSSSFAGQGLSYGKVYLFHIVLVFVLFKSLSNLKSFIPNVERIKPSITLIIAGVYSIVSLFWSSNPYHGVIENIQLWLGIILVLLVQLYVVDTRRLNFYLKIVIWINLIVCLGESVELYRYPLSEYSFLAEYFGKSGSSPALIDYPTGLHWNPNINAFFILFTFPLLMSESRMSTSFIYYLLSSWVIYMSFSRVILAAWVLMSLVLIFFLVFNFYSKRKIIAPIAVFTLLFFLSFFTLGDEERVENYSTTIETVQKFSQFIPKLFIKRMQGEEFYFNFVDVDWSLHLRLTSVDGLIILLKENLFWGVGAGSLKGKTHTQAGQSVFLDTPHFYFLELMTKYGVIGFSFYCLWFLLVGRDLCKKNKMYLLSFVLIIIFNPVLATIGYFLPVWGFFAYASAYVHKEQLE